MSNKTLVIIFSVLLIVLLGEIGYLFFSTPVIDAIKKNSVIPSCTPPQLVSDPLVSALSLDAMSDLTRRLDKKNEETVTYKLVTTGYIKDIEKINADNVEHTAFTLYNKDNEIIRNTSVKEGEIIYKIVDGAKISMSPEELQNNQKVEMTLIFDVADFDKRAYRELVVY